MLDDHIEDVTANQGLEIHASSLGVTKRTPGVQALIGLTVVLSACQPSGPSDVDMTGTWIGSLEVQTCTNLTGRMCEANDFGRRGHRYAFELQINNDRRVQIQIDPGLIQRMSGEAVDAGADSELSFQTDLFTRFDVLVANIDCRGNVRGSSISGTAAITYVNPDRVAIARTAGRLSASRR